MTASDPAPVRTPPEPWFERRRSVTLAVAGVLFVAVFLLRMLAGDPVDAYSMLYVLPVALVAMSHGRRAGAVAGLVAVALIVVWAVTKDVSLTPTGWASRVVPILLLGVLLGDAADRVRRADDERRQVEAAALLHREAIEINDSLVQGLTAAKWALESGNPELAGRTLDGTIERAQVLVSGLIRRAGMGGRTEQLGGAD